MIGKLKRMWRLENIRKAREFREQRAEELFNIVKRNGKNCLVMSGVPISEDGKTDAELVSLMFTLRERYAKRDY